MHMRAALLPTLLLAVAAWTQTGLARDLGSNDYALRRMAKPAQARRYLQSTSSAVADNTTNSDSGSTTNSSSVSNSSSTTNSSSDTTSDLSTNSSSNTSTDQTTTNCTPIAGMSVGTGAMAWWPFSLKQFANGTAQSSMPISSPQEADNATLGTYGADVTILQLDPVPWHIQLSSVPAVLEAGKYYTLKYTARSSVPAALQVAIVKVEDCDCNWQVFYVSQPRTTTQSNTYTVLNLSPTTTARYLLNFDLAQAASGTVFSFDDIMVCQQPTQVQATSLVSPSTRIANASEDFESTASNYIYQLQMTAQADVNMRSAAAAYSGQFGAAITIKKTGTTPWHIQLAGQTVALSAVKSYTVQLALKLINAGNGDNSSNSVLVTWVDPESYVTVSVSAVQPSSTYQVFSLPAMSPPSDGLYYLTVDVGLLQQDTTVYVDDIQVLEV